MEATSPRIRSLLRQARKTAQVGKRAAAQQLYEEILQESPETVEAWLGLADVSRDPQAQREAYERVLELDPGNETAREELGHPPQPAAEKERPPEAPDDAFDTRRWLEEATRRRPVDGQDGAAPAPAAQPATGPVATPVPEAASAAPEVEEEPEEVLYCYRHPERETGLRCITCNRPICTRCAQHTPVGYRCPQCIREAQDVFFVASALDYVLAGAVALILGLLAGFIVPRIGFFVIFIGPAAGTLIGRAAFRAARRHHGRYLALFVAAMVALGGFLPAGLPLLLALFMSPASIVSLGLRLLWPALYVFLATGAAYYQVK